MSTTYSQPTSLYRAVQGLGFTFLISASGLAMATESATVQHQIEVTGQTHLVIDNGVGSIELRYSDSPYVEVEVALEGKRSGWLRRKVDVSEMDIRQRISNDTIRLSFNEDNVNARFIVYAPSFAQTQMNLGVGQVSSRYFEGDLSISVGVGEAQVTLDPKQLGSVSASVGVGGIDTPGVNGFTVERRVVSATLGGHGEGDYRLSIDVGVGDINIAARSE